MTWLPFNGIKNPAKGPKTDPVLGENSQLDNLEHQNFSKKSRKAEICHIRFFIYQNPCDKILC